MLDTAERNKLIDEMLTNAKTIAVLGMSDKTYRASHNIGRYLATHGYRVVPVNPQLSEIAVDGKVLTCYRSLEEAQAAVAVEGGKLTSSTSSARRSMCPRSLPT